MSGVKSVFKVDEMNSTGNGVGRRTGCHGGAEMESVYTQDDCKGSEEVK